jgi:hypothetical protein
LLPFFVSRMRSSSPMKSTSTSHVSQSCSFSSSPLRGRKMKVGVG